MGPFEFKNVINEIQIRQGKWVSVLGQISENELSQVTATPQTTGIETSKETTETTETVEEKDSTTERPKVSAMLQATVFLLAVFGVIVAMIFVLHLRSRVSK
jgi:predicted phage gp36 major capsid-like protein